MKKTSIPGYGRLAAFLLALPLAALAAWTSFDTKYLPSGTYLGGTSFSTNGNEASGYAIVELIPWQENGSAWSAVYFSDKPMRWITGTFYNQYVIKSDFYANESSAYWAECRSSLLDGYAELYAEKN